MRGSVDAVSLDKAREELRKKGLVIEDIREDTSSLRKEPQNRPLPWSAQNTSAKPHAPEEVRYAPLHETLRIFAGWLLAWYGLIYALGFLEHTQRLPTLPFVHELFISPLVLQFTFGTFLLLALSNIHHWCGKGLALGLILSIAWVALVAGFVWYG